MIRRTSITCAACALALFVVVTPAVPHAQTSAPRQLSITAANPDALNGQMTISGVNFGSTPGQVTLAGLDIGPTVGWSDTQIIVALPPFPPGSYLLTVARDAGNGRPSITSFNVFEVALGAAGSQGEQGIQGAQGEKGEKGDQGIQGIQGMQGIQGIQGASGLLASFDALAGLPCTSATGETSAVRFEGPQRSPICPEPGAARFTDLGLVVVDAETNLMWEKKVLAGGLHDAHTQFGNWCAVTGLSTEQCGSPATSWIGSVNAENFAGFSDWRVPTADELLTIVDMSIAGCGPGGLGTPACIDPIFGPTQAKRYWSSILHTEDSALAVNFFNGVTGAAVAEDDALYARAVRNSP